jgi:hypothetical protein
MFWLSIDLILSEEFYGLIHVYLTKIICWIRRDIVWYCVFFIRINVL